MVVVAFILLVFRFLGLGLVGCVSGRVYRIGPSEIVLETSFPVMFSDKALQSPDALPLLLLEFHPELLQFQMALRIFDIRVHEPH